MAGSTALLLTRNSSLVREIHRLGADLPGLRVETCAQPNEVADCLACDDVVLVLLHLTTATEPAIAQLLSAAQETDGAAAIVVLADPDVVDQEAAILTAGAADFLPLPLQPSRLLGILQGAAANTCDGQAQLEPPEQSTASADPFFNVHAPEMVELIDQVRRVAPQDTTLLFTGETGTGKTRLARLVHEFSPRARSRSWSLTAARCRRA